MLTSFLFALLIVGYIQQVVTKDIPAVDLRGCGRSKSCLRWSSCAFDKCQFGVTWKPIKVGGVDYLELEISAITKEFTADTYVAVGFSDDSKMGDDGVVGCYSFNNALSITAGYNPGYYNRLLDEKTVGSTFLLGSTNNSDYGIKYIASTKQLVCRFARRLKPTLESDSLKDLTKSTNYFLATVYGPMKSLNGFSKHNSDTKRMSLASYGFRIGGSFVDSILTSDYTMIKIHGCMMMIGWIMLLSNGIIIATFYKSSWSNQNWCGKKIWFQIHRICQSIGVLCVIVGFIVIFVRVGGYSSLNKYPDLLHPIFGIISVGLMFLNPIMALCRCDPKHPRRPLFNWMHFCVGITSFILAIVNVGIGLQMPLSGPKLSTVIYPVIILAGFAACWLLLYVYGKIVQRVYGTNKIDVSISVDKRDSQISTTQSTRLEILIFAVLISFGFGAALIVVLFLL